MGLDHSCRHWSRGRVPKTGRCSVCFFSKLRCCLQSGKRRVLGGTEQPQTQLYQVRGLYAKADLSDSSALMLRETSNLNLFFGWKIESPWSPRETTSVLVQGNKVASPFPPNFPITLARQCPAITSRRKATAGKVEAGKPRRSAGPMRGQGWTRRRHTPFPLGIERPVLFLEAT